MRTDDTPLTEEEQIDQDNLTAKVCDNARKRLAEQPANPPERYRGKIVLGVNEIPKYLNEQSAQGYSLCEVITADGYIYVLVEKEGYNAETAQEELSRWLAVLNPTSPVTHEVQEFHEDADRPPHWE